MTISQGRPNNGLTQTEKLKKIANSLAALDFELEQMFDVLLDFNVNSINPLLDIGEVLEIAEEYSNPDSDIGDKSTSEDSTQT